MTAVPSASSGAPAAQPAQRPVSHPRPLAGEGQAFAGLLDGLSKVQAAAGETSGAETLTHNRRGAETDRRAESATGKTQPGLLLVLATPVAGDAPSAEMTRRPAHTGNAPATGSQVGASAATVPASGVETPGARLVSARSFILPASAAASAVGAPNVATADRWADAIAANASIPGALEAQASLTHSPADQAAGSRQVPAPETAAKRPATHSNAVARATKATEAPAAKAPVAASRSAARSVSRSDASQQSAACSDEPATLENARTATDPNGAASGGSAPGPVEGASSAFSAPGPSGFAQIGSNEPPIPIADSATASGVPAAVATPARAAVREIDLDLSSGGLEDVSMTMRLQGDRLSVVIRAASPRTAGAIEGAREAIAERLAAIGQPLGSLVIQQTGATDGTGKAAEKGCDDGGHPGQSQARDDGRGGDRGDSGDFQRR